MSKDENTKLEEHLREIAEQLANTEGILDDDLPDWIDDKIGELLEEQGE